ncbi:NUDIX hydrolase [Granulibacter bethesdensis]|uniref:NUDIX hydrolase n=1 Tax=Granulibacter bethesdensis TaxID=364410 RepID=UPI0003F204D5|nr:NUDIX hydrolase [Granulibacter bethesdensis]AHJ66422.1 Phosphohydrolase (MutT/nudix family protein) [Granulibacter bethesdensis CGDNIH4]
MTEDCPRLYPARPLVGVGVALLRPDGAVLLIRRGKPPAEGCWTLPGGAQRLGERAEDAAWRELQEETGLVAGALSLVAHVDSITRDEAGRIAYHYTILDFAGLHPGGNVFPAGDVVAADWVMPEVFDRLGVCAETRHVIGLARQTLSLT